jgi:NAD dependent epimerase/dehydratase family enzyme
MMILITGSNGLLGQKLVKHLSKKNIPFIATSKGKNRNPDCMDASYSTMDICSPDDIKSVFNRFIPSCGLKVLMFDRVFVSFIFCSLCEAIWFNNDV